MIRKNLISKILSTGFVILCAGLLPGCAANYFPLKNTHYFETPSQTEKKAIILPFALDLSTVLSKFNTRETMEKKRKEAETYLINGFKDEFPGKHYRVVDALDLEKFENNEYPREVDLLMTEIMGEIELAYGVIGKNLDEEKGKNFDYKLGTRVKELKTKLKTDADVFIFLTPAGYVANLAAYDSTALKTANAVLSLGMSLLIPTPDDVVYVQAAIIDADTGDIIWMNHTIQYAMSYLSAKDVRNTVHQLLLPLP